jgi:hypothetical protein
MYEWYAWLSIWDVAGETLTDRRNSEGRLGAWIDQIQEEFRLLLIARMNALNLACLDDRGRVGYYVFEVVLLQVYWNLQGSMPRPLPWEPGYCVDIVIDAVAPPVLTPGEDALMPIDIRVRFTDGVELPDQELSVAITPPMPP